MLHTTRHFALQDILPFCHFNIHHSVDRVNVLYFGPRFLSKLHQECEERHDVEHNKKYSKNDFAERSYDGQKYVVQLEIKKYMKHITEKIDYIDKYLHHLHITEIKL